MRPNWRRSNQSFVDFLDLLCRLWTMRCPLYQLCFLVIANYAKGILAKTEASELLQLSTFVTLSHGIHTVEYLNRTSGCIQNHILHYGDRGSPRRPCRKTASVVVKDIGIIRKTGTVENVCSYAFYSFTVISLSLVQITIKVSNCPADRWTTVSGGSSLRVELTRDIANTGSCLLQCINDEDYTYHCSLNHKPSTECNSLCGYNVSATVDYEHYMAFDEVAGLSYGLNKPVISHQLPPLTASNPNFKPKPNVRMKSRIACCTPQITNNQYQANGALLDSYRYSSVKAVLDRFASVYFVGSSHIRYLWDTLVHDHYNASALLTQLPQHHADEKVANTWYINNYFTMELPALLRDICSEGSIFAPAKTSNGDATSSNNPHGNTVVFVIESGSWDLDFNPAQNILLFPNSSTAVVDAILAMTKNNYRCNGRKVEIVWSTSVPIPECLDLSADVNINSRRQSGELGSGGRRKEKTCFDKGYRNNYAIRAINQYFVHALSAQPEQGQVPAMKSEVKKSKKRKKNTAVIPSPTSNMAAGYEICSSVNGKANIVNLHPQPNVHIVDAFEAIYPYCNDNVCGLHYLCCKHFGKNRVEIQYSPGGVEWMRRVLDTLALILNNT